MKRMLLLVALTCAYHTQAQNTLITEINAGDVWINATSQSNSIEIELEANGIRETTNTNNNLLEVTITHAFHTQGEVTPLIAISAGNNEIEDDKSSIYNVRAGVQTAASSDTSVVAYAGYTGSSDEEIERPSSALGILLGTQSKGFYNQFSVDYTIQNDTDNTSGGNTLSLSENIKFTPSDQLVLTGLFGLGIVQDIEQNGIDISYGPSFAFGANAELFLTKEVGLALTLLKTVGSTSATINNIEVDGDLDSTLIAADFNLRF